MTASARPLEHRGAAASAPVMTHRQILLVIYGLMAGMFLSALAQTVFGTAIRTIGDDLRGLDQQAWVTTAYLITSTITTPIYGKLSDIFGRRPLFIFGISIFVIGSLLSTFSSSMLMLAAFRAFQGIGAGALMSLPLAIMGDMLAPRERAKYQGYFLAVFGISSVIGPLVGGVLAGANQILWIDGWRWVFLINLPIGIVALAMVIAFLHLPKVGEKRQTRIDWWGATAVIVTLVPLLLVAEQGREWGWGSAGAIACYLLGAGGLVAFLIIESRLGEDAIIPLKLFSSGVFSMATVLSFLVGFAMFGAMLTIPLYLQIVTGLTPTEAGFATLPLVVGLMIASIGSGQIVARTGKYRIFPVTGTAFTAAGFFWLTFTTVDSPLWVLMIGMFLIGFGLGQLMQTLTLASQSAVDARDMGVATSSATFFRQIGGTLGTAVLLSVLFALIPTNISASMQNRTDLSAALDAALTPSVATDPANAGVMGQIWTPIVGPVQASVQSALDKGTAVARQAADQTVVAKVTAAVQQQVAAGALPASAAQRVIATQAAAATPTAEQQALAVAAGKANASVVDGKLAIDYADPGQRKAVVDKAVPAIAAKLRTATNSSGSGSSVSDTSFLNGADSRLTRPFLVGFNASTIVIFWIGLGVVLLAFVLTWFFRTPPLRQKSALQEQADRAGGIDDLEAEAVEAANLSGALIEPNTSTGSVPAGRR